MITSYRSAGSSGIIKGNKRFGQAFDSMTAGMTSTSIPEVPGSRPAAQVVSTSAVAPPTDEQLVQLLRDGAPGAGEVLVKRYCQPLMRYLQRIVGSDHLA